MYKTQIDYSYLDKDLFGKPYTPENPKLSICLITYKHADYIRNTLDNILSQEVNCAYEILIGEDCSPDKTGEIIAEYALKYPDKIKAYIRSKNVGAKTNSLHCFLQCKGEYIVLIEGDDYWSDNSKLQTQIDFLDANANASACFHNAEILYDDGSGRENELINNDNQPLWTYTEDFLAEKETWFMATASVMMRRKYVSKIPNWFVNCKSGDIPLYFILAEKGPIGYINKCMSVYRKNLGGQSFTDNTKSKEFIQNRMFMYSKINEYTAFKYNQAIRNILGEYHLLLINCLEHKSAPIKKIYHLFVAYFMFNELSFRKFKWLVRDNLISTESTLAYLNFRSKINRLIGK